MKRLLFSLISISMLFSCTQKQTMRVPENPKQFVLNTPVVLQSAVTEVVLGDYFTDPTEIDSVTSDADLKLTVFDDKKLLTITPGEKLDFLSDLKLWSEGYAYSVMLKKSDKVAHTFVVDWREKKYEKVQLKGEFNAWNPANTALEYNDGKWQVTLMLSPGRYQYLVVADGKELLDPGNSTQVDNGQGGFNSLLIIDDQRDKAPRMVTDSYEEDALFMRVENAPAVFQAYWENYLIPQCMINHVPDGVRIRIPRQAANHERSFIRVYAYNQFGISNDILIPLHYGKVVDEAAQLTRFDQRANVLYFLLVDRFNNGNTTNDWKINSPKVHPKADYHGGDLAGVTQKIKDGYFEKLGINTIWLSPIAQNPTEAYGLWKNPRTEFSGYHGYWPVSSSKVDFRFGTSNELKELVALAHKNNLNVILDYVANHVHQDHPVYRAHPEWATNLYLPDGTLNTEKWDEHRLTTWFDTFLPTLDLENFEVTQTMSDSALFWLTEYNLDGLRHDATKHIPQVFWRTLTTKIKKTVMEPQKKRIYQVGETYGSRELIASYINSGEMDGQFDFNLYDDAVATFARPEVTFQRLSNSLNESFRYYGVHNRMGYITGNHDRARFISYASGDVRFDEDAKLAGWTREIKVSDKTAYKKLMQLIGLNMTIPGIPVIYYGDEIGSPGGNDPDNRRMMKFDGLNEYEESVRDYTRKITHLRRNNLALMYGDFEELIQTDKQYVFMRKYFDQVAIVAFNKDPESTAVSIKLPKWIDSEALKAQFGSVVAAKGNTITLTLKGNGFEMLTN